MSRVIVAVTDASPAKAAGVMPGDRLLAVNGHGIADVFDYRYYGACEHLVLTVSRDGVTRTFEIDKDEEGDAGLVFESGLMDKAMSCANCCVFCFVAQNPRGMRDTLYFRDDDWRLSFLTGNYITMTNMKPRDFKRLCFYHLSPINVSVHAVTGSVRRRIMGNPRAGGVLRELRRLKRAGIDMNFQIVLCKGINDGRELTKTVMALAALAPRARSLSVVPVGITAHRHGLVGIEPWGERDALEVVRQVEGLNGVIAGKIGESFVWAADEFYVKAGLDAPGYEYYDGMPQLENGVGMLALFKKEFDMAIIEVHVSHVPKEPVYIVTGTAAAGFIRGLVARLSAKYPALDVTTIAVANRLFGETVTVSGLLTGCDIIDAVAHVDMARGGRLLFPANALRAEGDLFLDGMTPAELEERLGIPVAPVRVDGAAFVRAILGGYTWSDNNG